MREPIAMLIMSEAVPSVVVGEPAATSIKTPPAVIGAAPSVDADLFLVVGVTRYEESLPFFRCADVC